MEPVEGGLLARVRSEFGFIRGNFLIIVLGWILIDFTQEMAFTYYPLYVEALGGTVATVGLIGSVAGITQALIMFPGGYIADKYGRKRIITTMTFLAAFAYLFYALAPNWQTVMVGAVLCSLCWIYHPAFNALVMDSLPPDKRGTGYSIINLITGASTTPSPLLAGLLYASYGLMQGTRIAFALLTVAFLIAGLLRTKIKETVNNTQPIDTAELLHSFSGARAYIEGISVWGVVPRPVLVLLIIQILFTVPNAMLNVCFMFYITEELGITLMNWAVIGSVISASVIVLAIPCGKLIDRVGRKRPLLAALALIVAAMPFLIWGDFYKLLVIAPVIALVNIIFGTAIQALNADLVPEEHRGKISGSRSFFLLIALSVGQILGGLIYDNVSHQLPLFIFWAATVPIFLLTLLFIEEKPVDLD